MGASLSGEQLHASWRAARWQITRVIRRELRTRGLGTLLVVLAALLPMAAGLTWWSLARDTHAAQSALAAARRMPPDDRASAPVDEQESLARYYAELPVPDALPGIIEDLIRLGGTQRVSLSVGEYRVQSDNLTRAASYRIRFPVSGDAAAIQRFVLEALNRYPTLALEALSMRRESIGSARVEANIQFNLLFARSAEGAR